MSEKLLWHTEKRRIDDLIPYEHNPRQMSEKQVKDLTKSLEKFDLVEIPAIDTDNKIIAGHQRLKIMQLIGRGEEEIDVRLPSRKLTDKEFQEYNIRSNKNTGEWSFDGLANNFEIEDLKEWGFDEKDLRIDLNVIEDEVPEVKEEAVSKTGEIYQLGRHRLMCGDSTKKEDVEKLMDGQKADMVFTDPPYGMDLDTDFSGMVGFAGKVGNKFEKVIGDEHDYDPAHIFDLFGYCGEIILWGADYYSERIPRRNDGSWFVWDKQSTETEGVVDPNDSYGKMFGSNFELAWSKTRHKRSLVRVLWKGMFGMQNDDTKKRVHPTQKPAGLATWFLNKFSKENNIIIDLFLGSGSTLIACEQTNRACYGMELDPRYVDVIRKRYAKFIGKEEEWQEITKPAKQKVAENA